MKNRLVFIVLSLWMITIGAFAYFFVYGWTTPGTDQRLAVQLAPAERDLILSEMRQMLTSGYARREHISPQR